MSKKSDPPKPEQWERLTLPDTADYKGRYVEIYDGMFNLVKFRGPDHEENARKFILMDDLVEAAEVVAADSQWVSGEPNFERFRNILAKIKGAK